MMRVLTEQLATLSNDKVARHRHLKGKSQCSVLRDQAVHVTCCYRRGGIHQVPWRDATTAWPPGTRYRCQVKFAELVRGCRQLRSLSHGEQGRVRSPQRGGYADIDAENYRALRTRERHWVGLCGVTAGARVCAGGVSGHRD